MRKVVVGPGMTDTFRSGGPSNPGGEINADGNRGDWISLDSQDCERFV